MSRKNYKNLVDLTRHLVTGSITAEGVANPLDWDIRFDLVFYGQFIEFECRKRKRLRRSISGIE